MLKVESIEEIVKNADVNKLVNGEPTLLDGLGMAVKFVKRGHHDEEVLLLDDVVEKKIDLPILSEDLRKDVYTFFNNMLTNFYNRKFVSGLCDVIATSDGKVDQARIVIANYSEDREDLINSFVNVDSRFSNVVNNNPLDYELELEENVREAIFKDLKCPDDVLPLVFLFKLDFIKLDHVKLPTSERLRNGNTLLLLDPEVVLPGIGLKSRAPANDTVVITDDGEYLLSKSFNNRATIRKLECGELFTNRKHEYKI
jgi:hypothetical protein